MPTTLETAVAQYLRSGNPAQRTREEYSTTLRMWERWGGGLPLDQLGRKEVREFLDWVYVDAAAQEGRNPGRTAHKVRSHLPAVMSWAWEQDLVDSLPRFPKHKPQRDVAGRTTLGAQRSSEDLYDVLRRASSRVVGRNPWPFRGGRHVPPLCSSRTLGVQSDHHTSTTFSILRIGQRLRRPMPVLQKAIHGRTAYVILPQLGWGVCHSRCRHGRPPRKSPTRSLASPALVKVPASQSRLPL